MTAVLDLLMWLVVLGIVGLVVLAVRRTSRLGRTGHGVSSGLASGLADVNAIFQPHQPTASVIAQAKEGDEEHDDDGDPPDPPARRHQP